MPDYIFPPTTLAPGSVVWGYLRDSGGDTQEQSVRQQKAELIHYCQRYGLVIAHIFADVAKSGGSVVGRNAFLDAENRRG
jgi:DNA invertase Pin-like site-specific DNA recombinase